MTIPPARPRVPRWMIRLTAVCSALLMGTGMAAAPAAADPAPVHPADWLWNWWYRGPNDFGFAGALTGVAVSGSGTDFGGVRRVSGVLVDTDHDDGACAELVVEGPDRKRLLSVFSCNGDDVPFQSAEIAPRGNSNQVVFALHQVMQDESGTGAAFRDRVQSSVNDDELKSPLTWAGWRYSDDRTFSFWATRPRMMLEGTATDEPDGSRTAHAAVTATDPTGRLGAVTGTLWGDQFGKIQSTPTKGDPRVVEFGRSMLLGNLYYQVRQREDDPSCGIIILCGRIPPRSWELTGKVTLPGSGM